jgi:hypothetical protein
MKKIQSSYDREYKKNAAPYPQYLSAMRISFIHSPTSPLILNKASTAQSNITSPSPVGSTKPYSVKRVEFGCEPYFKNNSISGDVTKPEGDRRVKSCPNVCFMGGAVFHMSAGEAFGSVYGG